MTRTEQIEKAMKDLRDMKDRLVALAFALYEPAAKVRDAIVACSDALQDISLEELGQDLLRDAQIPDVKKDEE